jgi:uncharacterized protein
MSHAPEPPLVVRVNAEAPLVRRVHPEQPRLGLGEACILTIGYWVALFGSLAAVIVIALAWHALFGQPGALETQGPGTGPMTRVPPALHAALAWSMPVGYLGGLVFMVFVLRRIVGRTWFHDIGLKRVPPFHLAVAILALPAFIVLSDALAGFVQQIDGPIHRITGLPELGDSGAALKELFAGYHWSFAVFAIGVGPGFVEELWCRGFLGRGLIGRYGWFAGVALTSLFFGLLHLWLPSCVIVTATMGAALHFAFIASRSLWVPIVVHLANNSFAALAAVGAVPTGRMDRALLVQPVPIIVAAACLLLFCGLAMWHSRWTWPGEKRGEAVPPKTSAAEMTAAKPDLVYTVSAIGFCAALLWLLAA